MRQLQDHKTINVLFMVDKSGFGGVQTIAYNLMNYNIGNNLNVYYFFLRDINKKFKMEQIRKPNVFYSKSNYKYSPKPLLELRSLIQRKQIDILHMNGNKSIILGTLLKRYFFPNIKIIAHEHGGVFDFNIWYLKFLRLMKDRIDLFICLSKYKKELLIKNLNISSNKIVVLYNFVDMTIFDRKYIKINIKKEKEKWGIKKDEFVIGYFGGLSKIKGCDILIKMLPYINFKYRTIIAGAGPEMEKLTILTKKLGINKKVIFTGYKSNPVDIYPLFDVLVIPSRSEAFGIVALEARSLGIPVIASNVDGLKEIISDKKNGLLFDVSSKIDLREKITLLRSSKRLGKSLAKMGLNDMSDYSLDKYLENLEYIYGNVKKQT